MSIQHAALLMDFLDLLLSSCLPRSSAAAARSALSYRRAAGCCQKVVVIDSTRVLAERLRKDTGKRVGVRIHPQKRSSFHVVLSVR
jgi:hypothetical protein